MKSEIPSPDPDIRASWPALLRAARRARRPALATGTPLYVMKDGKVVNLNPKGRLRRRSR
jgi:hypothetical protein